MLWRRLSLCFLSFLTFSIPIEHKYDKLFRFFSLTLIPPHVSLPSFFERKIYFYPSDLLAFVFFFMACFSVRIPLSRFFFARGSCYLWIIFFCTFLSILFSPLSHYPILYIRLLQFFTPLVLFSFLTHGFPAEESPKLTTLLFGCMIAAAIIQAGIAIAQYAIQGPLHLRLLSEPKIFSGFSMSKGSPWLFTLHSSSEPIWVIRPSGTFPHANVLGGFLSVSILASYSFFSRPHWKKFFQFLIPFLFFAMCLTFSRSAFFSWILGTLLWFGLHLKTPTSPALRSVGVNVLLSLFLSLILLHEPIIHRGGIFNYNSLVQGSDALRIRYQNVALQVIKDHPFFGAGFHQLSLCSPKYIENDPTYPTEGATHNIYLHLAAETGLFSLAAFLLFIFSLFWAVSQTPFTPQVASLIAMWTAFLFIGICDFYPLLFQQGKLSFFLIAGLLAANARSKQELTLERA